MFGWARALVACVVASATLLAQDFDELLLRRIAQSQDAPWLESFVLNTGSAPTLLGSVSDAGWVRTTAYFRLGQLGATAELDRVEARLRDVDLVPDLVQLSNVNGRGLRTSDVFTKISTEGVTYALLGSFLLGGPDVFVISSRTPDDPRTWTRPRLTTLQWQDVLPWTDVSTRWIGPRMFEVAYQEGPRREGAILGWFPRLVPIPPPPPGTVIPIVAKTHVIDLDDVFRDTDKDGWTDLEEVTLGLNPVDVDSDGDGLSDGRDTCPDFAPPKPPYVDRRADMIARAFYTIRGFDPSRQALRMIDDSVHFWGYAAPIMRRKRSRSPTGLMGAYWSIERESDSEATVWISAGPESGERLVLMRRVAGRWVAIRILGGRIS